MNKLGHGFTLIELLIVMAILSILATIGLVGYRSAQFRGRDAARKSDLKNLSTALRLYYNDYGKYPASDGNGRILGCGAVGTSICDWGDPWDAGGNNYMGKLPEDPDPNLTYRYEQVTLDSFSLRTCLENSSDDSGKPPVGITCSSNLMFELSQN